MNMQLQRFGPEPAVVISKAAIENRNDAIADAKEVLEVDSPETQERAASALRGLRLIEKECESDRKAIKTPVRRLGELIDETVHDHMVPVLLEITRLNWIMSAYQEAERKKLIEAQKKQREEEARIERVRQAAVREAEEKARQARRIAEEQMRKGREEDAARADKKRIQAEQEAQAAKEEADRLAQEQRLEAAKEVAAAAPARAEGLVVREVWEYEVLDLQLLHRSHPSLVKVEPNRAAILEAIRGGMRKCPGLVIWSETKTTVRT